MPSFDLTTHTEAPVEEVWKLLHDPSRFPEWWAGVETVEVRTIESGASAYTMWPDGYPDFPMDQRLHEAPGRVTISCLVSDLVFVWQLREAPTGTEVDVHVEIPEQEAHRLEDQQRLIEESLRTLAHLAAA